MFNKIAPDYFKLGINVVPVQPGTKACTEPKWRKINFESQNKKYNDYGIGLDLGANEIVVLDIDTLDKEAQKEIEEFLKDYPTPVMRQGNPDKLPSRFYSRTWQEKKLQYREKIELLTVARGGESMCVLPPTIHPEIAGVSFKWVTEKTLLNFPVNDLPVLPEEAWEGVCRIYDKYATEGEVGKTHTITPSDGTRCNHGSHIKLSSILVASIHAGETPETIVKKLLAYDEKYNEKVSFFLCRTERWQTPTRELNCFKFVLDGFNRNINKGEISSVPVVEQLPTIGLGKNVIKEKVRATFPDLTGAGDELFQICYNHSPVQRSRFTAASVLSLMSILMANRYSYKGIQPNLYTILITDQGGGKDFPLKFPRDVLFNLGLNELVGMGNPGSDVALLMNLSSQKERIDTLDEVTKLFKGMSSTSSSHMNAMAEVLNELYTSPGKYFGGKTAQKYQSKDNSKGTIGECFSPYLTIISATTFAGFGKTFTEEIFESGLGSRFLYITDNDEKPPRDTDPRFEIPHDLGQFLRKLRQPIKGDNFLNASGKPDLFEMPITEKASELVKEFDHYCYQKRISKKETPRIKSIYSRLSLTMKKIMMIDAVIRNYEVYPTIKVDSVEWAIRWATAYLKTAEDTVNNLVNSSKFEAELTRIESLIIEAGEEGILLSSIGRMARGVPNYKSHIARLLEGESIIKGRLANDTPKATRYFDARYSNAQL
jgi:hypothetical protein